VPNVELNSVIKLTAVPFFAETFVTGHGPRAEHYTAVRAPRNLVYSLSVLSVSIT